MDYKAVNMRVPMVLYERIKEISDQNHMTVSSVIFYILDRHLFEKTNGLKYFLQGLDDETVYEELKTSNEPRIRELLQRLLQDNNVSGYERKPGSRSRKSVSRSSRRSDVQS